jgi:hypothetical protein
MATREQVLDAFTKADAAGDTASAQHLHDLYMSMGDAPTAKPPVQHASFGENLWTGTKNLASDAADIAKIPWNLGQALMHPQQTAQAVGGMVHSGADIAGGLMQQVRNLSPAEYRGSAPPMDTAPAQAFEQSLAPRNLVAAAAQHPLNTALMVAPVVGPAMRAVDIGAGLAGGAAKGAAAKMGDALAEHAAATKAPSIAEMRSQAGGLYEAAKNQGVVVKGEAFKTFAADLSDKLNAEGLDPALQPRATAALKRIVGADGNVDIQQLDNLRKISTGAAEGTLDKSDRRLARMITDKLDDFVSDLKPADLLAGDATKASDMLTQARDLWTRQAKGQVIEDKIAKAKGNAGGIYNYDTALRSQFRTLANNPRGMARFSPEEQDAIKKVASGGPVSDLIYQAGKLAPTSHLSLLAEAGLATGATGHAGLGMAALGVPAKALSTATSARNAQIASALVRRGAAP